MLHDDDDLFCEDLVCHDMEKSREETLCDLDSEDSPFLTFLALERFFARMRAFVILEHVLVSERSLAHSASEDLIFAILRRLRTDGRTHRIRTFRRSLHFRFGGFPLRGATPPDYPIVIVHIVVVTVVIIVIIVVVVVIVIAPRRGLHIGGRRYFW